MVKTLTTAGTVSQGDTEMISVDFGPLLDSGELLTGTPTVAEQTTSDLTISNKAVSTAQLTILGSTVAIGEAVQFKITGQQAATVYTVRITVSTDASIARTFVRDVEIPCED